MRERPFDVIFSSAFPVTSHLVAGTLKWRSSLPWVAEFWDDWSEDPDFRVVAGPALRLERAIAKRAARVIAPTPTLASSCSARWGRPVDVVANGHDLQNGLDLHAAHVRPTRSTITHVGTYYPGNQGLRDLWAALAQLIESELENLPLIRFVGELPDEVRKETEDFRIGHLVEATGLLPHAEAVQAMMASTLLVASGYRGGDLRAQPGCHVIRFGAVDAVASVLKSELNGTVYQRDVGSLSRRARTAELAAILERCVTAA